MLSFKGTKGKDYTRESIKNNNYKLKTELLDTISPTKPNLPPLYSENDTYSSTYPQLHEKKSTIAPKLLSEIITINSGKNHDIMKITSSIDLVFDKNTGKLKEITSMMNDDIDMGYVPQKFNIPIPDIIKWLNKKHIILYSRKTIGTLLIIDSKEVVDEYPECISCVLFEKVNMNDNFDIKVIVNLKYENRYIKKSELLDVIYTNMNNFWIIIKQEDGIHLLYYYKSKKDVLVSKNSSDYVYTEFIIENYTFICSMWSIYDISPDVIYIALHDQYKNVSIHEYTIGSEKDTTTAITSPIIELYSVDSRLSGCGKYLSFCANYNISIFTILLEVENKEKHFYTGLLSLSQIDIHQKSQIKIEFSKTMINSTITNGEAQLMIYNIMAKTEESINKEEELKNAAILKQQKHYMAMKELEKASREMDRRDKEAKDIADKLLAEEDSKKTKKLIKINKDKQRLERERLEKQKRDNAEKLEKERLEKVKLEQELLEKERFEKEMLALALRERERQEIIRLEQEKIDKDIAEKEQKEKERLLQLKIEEDRLKKERLKKEKLEKEKLKKEKSEKAMLEKEKREKEKSVQRFEQVKRLENDRLEKEKLIQEKLIQEKLEQELMLKATSINSVIKPFYYISNEIQLNYGSHTLYFMFIHNLSMINPIVANEIAFSQSSNHYNELLLKHRFYVMYALDMLVINSSSIYEIKKIMDIKKDKEFPISAIYGSYLPILYSMLLNEIGFVFNAFNAFNKNKNKNSDARIDANTCIKPKPLDKLKDYDTLVLKLLDDYNETEIDTEFIREQSFLIGYNIDDKPVTRTKIQSSSIHNLICKCWDLNYTSAILLYEDTQQPYIKRHPDFTEFLFGQQPIQLLFGKDNTNLYNVDITMNRLKKALQLWY